MHFWESIHEKVENLPGYFLGEECGEDHIFDNEEVEETKRITLIIESLAKNCDTYFNKISEYSFSSYHFSQYVNSSPIHQYSTNNRQKIEELIDQIFSEERYSEYLKKMIEFGDGGTHKYKDFLDEVKYKMLEVLESQTDIRNAISNGSRLEEILSDHFLIVLYIFTVKVS